MESWPDSRDEESGPPPRQSHSPSGDKNWQESDNTSAPLAPTNYNSADNSEIEPSRDELNPIDREEEGSHETNVQHTPTPDQESYHNEEESFQQPDSRPDEEFSEQEQHQQEEHFEQDQQNNELNSSENEPQEDFNVPEYETNKTYQEEDNKSPPCDKNFSHFNSSQYEQEHDHHEESSPQQDQIYHEPDEGNSSFPRENNEEMEDSQDEPLHTSDHTPIQEQVPIAYNNYPNQNSNSSGPPLYGNEDDSQSQERFSASSVGENHTEEDNNYLSNNGGCEDFNAPVDGEDSREDAMFTNNSSSNYGNSLEGGGNGQNLPTHPCDFETTIPSKHHNNDGFYPNNHNSDTHLEQEQDENEESSPLPSNNFVGDNHLNEQHDVGVEIAEGGENGSS